MRRTLFVSLTVVNALIALAVWAPPAQSRSAFAVDGGLLSCCKGGGGGEYCCDGCCWFTPDCDFSSDCGDA